MRQNVKTAEALIIEKHQEALHQGFRTWPGLAYDRPPAMGDARWTADLILATWFQAETGRPPDNGLEYHSYSCLKSNGSLSRNPLLLRFH